MIKTFTIKISILIVSILLSLCLFFKNELFTNVLIFYAMVIFSILSIFNLFLVEIIIDKLSKVFFRLIIGIHIIVFKFLLALALCLLEFKTILYLNSIFEIKTFVVVGLLILPQPFICSLGYDFLFTIIPSWYKILHKICCLCQMENQVVDKNVKLTEDDFLFVVIPSWYRKLHKKQKISDKTAKDTENKK